MAISLTRAQAAELAWIMAAPGYSELETKLLIPHVEAMIDEAVRDMSESIAKSKDYWQLQNRISITFSSDASTGLGAATLSTGIMADTVKSSRGGMVWISTMQLPLSYVPNIDDLYLYHPGGGEIGYYCVRGGNFGNGSDNGGGVIYSANYVGAALTGAATLLACQYPTFATLPPQLEDEFLGALADMAREKLLLSKTTGRLVGQSPFSQAEEG